ncbi:MAG TPA: STAS domain-containing protein [Leptospiraceae bacterium]|nr:STAS domain-containing protein [Leptospirales bacterium]HMU81767.1 STAS domain-containing protein [Leptospiraceae bacterium]HMW59815.1 STAS domain-containing protein [Leptospiraceae bacterium]HMX56293.1 STAS domain-containing protein [Leptospiraceae bacterium]HMY47910.1 STAS domain-containing protein [Leptospiraceae bacterium]
MQIQSKEQDRYMLHRIEGEVDLYNSGVLKSALMNAFAANGKNILLDLSAMVYIDSTGMSVLFQTATQLREAKKDLKVFGATPAVMSVLSMVNVPGKLQICQTEEEAAMFFR